MSDLVFFGRGASKGNGWLSNFSKHSFRCSEDLAWPSVEHYFQAQKFYGDAGHMETIRMASSASEAKRFGQSREHRLRENYEAMKEELMLEGLRLKFQAHNDIKRKLLATKNSYLVELSDKDQYWGTKRDLSGKNRLGVLLMQLRHELGGEKAPPKPSTASQTASAVAESSAPIQHGKSDVDSSAPTVVDLRSVSVRNANVEKCYEAAVIVMPPQELWPQIQAIREKHDKAYERWMPHINLLFPFITEKTLSSSLEAAMSLALRQVEPFEVELSSFGTFEHSKSNVMFCQPKTTPAPHAIHELYAALVRLFPVCAEERPFHPHLTVGQFAKTQCDAKKRTFTESWKPLRWTCDKIAIIRRSGSTPFTVHKIISFGQGPETDAALHKHMEETLFSRLSLWLRKMNDQNHLPRTVDRLANAIANMSFVSYRANAELLYEELLSAGYVSVSSSGGAFVHSIAVENYRSEYSTVGQSYRYSGMGSSSLHSTEEQIASLALPSEVELMDMARDRSIQWVAGLKSYSGNAKSFFNQLKHICTFKVLLNSSEVVNYLHDRNVISLADEDCTKITNYNL